MADNDWRPEATREIAQLLKEIDICMLVTRSNGSVRGRPMSNNGNVEFDGDSWFFSLRETPKVAEIVRDPSVELAYVATERGTWISVEGTAEMVDDAELKRELWHDDLEGWFKDGPDDPNLVLIKVHADRIHAWANDEELIAEPGSDIKRIPG